MSIWIHRDDLHQAVQQVGVGEPDVYVLNLLYPMAAWSPTLSPVHFLLKGQTSTQILEQVPKEMS